MARIGFWLFMLVVLATFVGRDRLSAGFDGNAKVRPSPVELIVFEHPDCQFCRVFRRDVLPRYQEAPTANRAPIRFIDIERTETASLRLRGGIHVVPTFVLMEDGREVDRIVGYWAPENFFKMLSYMLARTSEAGAN